MSSQRENSAREIPTGHGRGRGAVVVAQNSYRWEELDVMFSRDDISRPTDWSICEDRHTVVVHLGGAMEDLQTELDGHGGSRGAALPGEIWTIPAGRRYASQARGGRIDYAVLFAPPDACAHLSTDASNSTDLAPRAGVRDDFLCRAVSRLRNLAGNPDDVRGLEAECLSCAIVRHIFRVHGVDAFGASAPARGPAIAPATARRLRDFVHDHLDGPLSLALLATVAGLTPHQFLIAFRRAFGASPAQYVIQQRLRHAQRLLTLTRDDLTTIALDCGFSSHSHLTSKFRQHLGTTPSQFRRRAVTE